MTRVGNTVAAAVVGIIAAVGLSGCTGSGGSNSVTITWTADGSGESRSFGVSNPLCSETGARTLSFPETPVRSLVVTNGLAGDDVEAWIFENEQAVVFRSENIALAVDERDDGSVEYRGTAVGGRVAVTQLTDASTATPPDVDAAIENAQQYDATIDFALTCPPAS